VNTTIDALTDRFAGRLATWLTPHAPGTATLARALETAVPEWPGAAAPPPTAGPPWLFPLLYNERPAVTPLLLHQLTDAAAEAQRAGRRLLLLTVPTGRSGRHPDAGETGKLVAAAFTGHGLPVEAAGDAGTQAGNRLADRAATTAFTRRAVDLPDLLTSASADALGAERIVLAGGLRTGRNLAKAPLLVPLARLHHPRDPFALPPPDAKRAPAGTDALWSSALALELTHSAEPDHHPDGYLTELGARLRPVWNQLRRQRVTGRQPDAEAAPVRISCDRHRHGNPVAVPLFGAPLASRGTAALVGAAALAGPVALVVDDLTPRWCYPAYPHTEARDQYRLLAAEHGGTAQFLTDLPDLPDLLAAALDRLTVAELRSACGPRAGRDRGALTGWDAVHLAVMAVACTSTTAPTLAAQAANLRQLATVHPTAATVSVTGTHTAGATATVPASWLTDSNGTP